MTTDQIRDELAAKAGWAKHHSGWWTNDGLNSSFDHPMPPTLDGANAAVPESASICTRSAGTARCSHCSMLLGGSFPPLGSSCVCKRDAVTHRIDWYRDHAAMGRSRMWGATAGDTLIAAVPDTGDPVHDLYALALACVKAKEATDGKA